jgi:phosphate transport system protein
MKFAAIIIEALQQVEPVSVIMIININLDLCRKIGLLNYKVTDLLRNSLGENMARENLIAHMQQIKDELLLMGSLVEIATVNAIDALRRRDENTARRIYIEDQIINQRRYSIENDVLILIATQQPMARDLRRMAAMLEIASELERMGDYAKGNCKVILNLGEVEIPTPNKEFQEMGQIAVEMLHRALTAFFEEDAETARLIPLEDDQVDKLFTQAQHLIIKTMSQHPDIIDHANLLLWVAHNIERMADRVTNICERTIFVATGELIELEVKPRNLIES